MLKTRVADLPLFLYLFLSDSGITYVIPVWRLRFWLSVKCKNEEREISIHHDYWSSHFQREKEWK